MCKVLLLVFVSVITTLLSGCGEQTKPSFISVGKTYKDVTAAGVSMPSVTIVSDKGNGWYEVESVRGTDKERMILNMNQVWAIGL